MSRNKDLQTLYASQYRSYLLKLEDKVAKIRKSIELGHSQMAKGWLKELANEANTMRRRIESEV